MERICQSLHGSIGPVSSEQHRNVFGFNWMAAYKDVILEDTTRK